MVFRITQEWFIDLAEDFENRIENEKLVFWKTGITVIVAAYRLPQDTGKIDLLNRIQKMMPEDTLETFVSIKGKLVGLGYTQIEKSTAAKNRLALYTFTASDTSCLQAAYYLDDPSDLDWAKSVWESIIYQPDPADDQDTPV